MFKHLMGCTLIYDDNEDVTGPELNAIGDECDDVFKSGLIISASTATMTHVTMCLNLG